MINTPSPSVVPAIVTTDSVAAGPTVESGIVATKVVVERWPKEWSQKL